MGFVEVVMTNSPEPMPETAELLSSLASTCTSTRVAVYRVERGVDFETMARTNEPLLSVRIAEVGTIAS